MTQHHDQTPDEIAAHVLSLDDAARREFLARRRDDLTLDVIQAFKMRADADMLRDANLALRLADISAEVAALLSDPLAEALSLWIRGNALASLGRYPESLDYFERARAIFGRHGQTREVVGLRVNEIVALRHLGRYEQALRAADKARAWLASHEVPHYTATLEMNVGILHYQRGDYEAALAAYERGRQLFVEAGNTVQVARMDVNRAITLESLDRFDEAERLLKEARATLLAEAMSQEVARVDLDLGVLAWRQGLYQQALRTLEQARSGFTAVSNPVEVAVVDLYRARVYLSLNLLPEALTTATSCEREFARQDMPRQIALALVAQGAAQRGMDNAPAALQLLDRARRIFTQRKAAVEVALIDVERAELRRLAGDVNTARRIARRAETALQTRGLLTEAALAVLQQAWCALDQGRPGQAEQLARAALQVADQLAQEILAYRAHHVLGRAAQASGQVTQALEEYRAAILSIERLVRNLWTDEFRAAFLADKLVVYEDAVRTALQLGRLEQAFELVSRANLLTQAGPTLQDVESAPDEAGRLLLDELHALRRAWHWKHSRLERSGDLESPSEPDRSVGLDAAAWRDLRALETRIAELTRRYRVQCGQAPGAEAEVCTLAAVQNNLDAQAVLAQYFVIHGRLGAFVVRPGQTDCHVDLGPIAQVEHWIKKWRFGLETLKLYPPDLVTASLPSLCADAQTHLRCLYDLLVAPLNLDSSTPSSGVRQLYLTLPTPLNSVPFAALFDGARYLIERWQIAHVVSGLAREAGFRFSSPLVVGYSDGGRLPLAVIEAQRVAEAMHLDGSRLLLEGAATEAEFERQCRQADLIHLSTHAAFRADNPFFSWVQLADAHPTVADLYSFRLGGCPLVTLSACETGLSSLHGGGLIGLSRALMAAGARVVVASLWNIEDAATADLMERFYRQLKDGQTASAALRSAQLEMLKRLRHPLYWAGFVVIEQG